MVDWMRLVVLSIVIALAPCAVAHAEESQRLLLVTDAQSEIQSMTLQDVRKVYLGRMMTQNGRTLEPLVNLTDESLYEVFLQKVMFMSAQAYQRVLARQFLHGQGHRPAVYRNRAELLAALSRDPNTVTFVMWMGEADLDENLKVITVLWDGKF